MTLRHLEILKAVAGTGNFTKAAQALFITQSAVSHAVRELEEEAGTLLFDRLNKSVRITERGRMLLEESLPLLASFQALETRLGQLEQLAPIRIVSSITIASYQLPAILTRFHGLWPELSVHVEVQSAAGAMSVLLSGGAELAFIEGAPPDGPFVCTPFSSYRLSLVCSPGFLQHHKPGTLQELCACPLLLREKGSAVRDTFDSSLYLHGLIPSPSWTSVNSGSLMEAARAGLGIAVLPEGLVEQALSRGELTALSFPGFSLSNQMIVLYHKEKHMTAPLKDLLSCVKAYIA